MEHYLDVFFEQYDNFRNDVIATFPEYESALPVTPESGEEKTNLLTNIVKNWQSVEVKKKIAREDESVFADTDPEPFMGEIPIQEIMTKCSEENKQVIWKYIKSFLVYGSAVINPVKVQISEDVKQKLVDAVDDKIIDDEEINMARIKTTSELFKNSPNDSKELRFMKKIFRTLANSVTAQLRGKNKKQLMKKLLGGQHEEVLNTKQLEREMKPLIKEMEEKINAGKLSEENFKREAIMMIENLQSQGGEGANLGDLMSQMGFSGGLSELLPKYDKFNAKEHYLPDMPDELPPVKTGSSSGNNKKKKKRKR